MARYSIKWKSVAKNNNITLKGGGFYVDNVLSSCTLRPGWRWLNGGLWFCQEWEQEDHDKPWLERMKNAVEESMKGLTDGLDFTIETEEDF